MGSKSDKTRIAADTLANLLTTGGAAAATVAGVPVVPAALAKLVVDGLYKLIIADITQRADSTETVARVQADRTARTIETIRDALIEATGLKPELATLIDEFVDAIEGKDEERLRQALLNLCGHVTEITAKLDDIAADTEMIKETTALIPEIHREVKAIKSAVLPRGSSQASSYAVQRHVDTRVETLSAEVRSLRDEQGQQKWEELNTALAERSFERTIDLARDLETWLDEQGDKVSVSTKGQALLTLADVAVIRDSGFPYDIHTDTSDAWRLLNKAESVFAGSLSDNEAQRMLCVRAKLLYLDDKHEDASRLLGDETASRILALRIAFLMDQERWGDASDLAEQQDSPDKKWADDAIVAAIQAGYDDRAERLLQWSGTQESTVEKVCVVAFVRTSFSKITGNGSSAFLMEMDAATRRQLLDLHEMLGGAFAAPLRDAPKSGVEAEALELVILIGHVLRDRDTCQNAADQLTKWKPAYPELGRAVLRGDVAPIDGLADRYLDESSDALTFQLLAAMLLIEVEHDASRAMSLLRPLLVQIEDDDQREEIGKSMVIAGQYCDEPLANEAVTDLESSFGADHRFPAMLRAMILAKKSSFLDAEAELARVEDDKDYLWLQLSAGIAMQREQWSTAARTYGKLGELVGRAHAFQNEAYAWHQADDNDNEVAALEKAFRLAPDSNSTVRNLAAAYHRADRYSDAAKQYRVLWQQESKTKELAINYASCLALDGDVTGAIAVLADHLLASEKGIAIEPLLMHAQLLHSRGKPADALESLLPHWDTFSEDYRYLLQILQLGHAADREEHASKAMQGLISQLDQGTLPDGVLTRFQLDDVLEMQEGWQQNKTFITQQYVSGRLPWIIASRWTHPSHHCYLSWRIRTQPLIPSDHPGEVGAFSLYSTNGFTATEEDGQRRLVRISAPTPQSEIVADVSALITLHRLGLLNALGSHFSKVFVPLSYKGFWIEEHARIPHHQPRQILSRQAITDAVSGGKIAEISEPGDTPRIDEYEKEGSDSFSILRILQVSEWMAKQGALPDTVLATVQAKRKQPALVSDEDVDTALQGGAIIVDAFTLGTIFEYGLLDYLCAALHVSISRSELSQVKSELENQRFCDEAGAWHRELVESLESTPNVEFVPLNDENEREDDDDHREVHYGLGATLLAIERNLPLLADDRHCQQAGLNVGAHQPTQAFGCDILIDALATATAVTWDQHADHFLQLIRWRYKFLFPSSDALLAMASRFKQGLPGRHLREVAMYMQDCLRDIGLYGGLEQVDPPTPMALKAFTEWTNIVADFVVRIWWDVRFSEEEAAELTRWAVRNFLPAWPKNLAVPSWRRIAETSTFALLSQVLNCLLTRHDEQKCHRVVETITTIAHISDEELAVAVGNTADSLRSALAEQGDEIAGSILVRLFQIAFGPGAQISWRLLPQATSLGLVEESQLRATPSDEFVSAIANREHECRLEPKVGPIAYMREGEQVTASFLPEMLQSASAPLRRAVVDNLLSATHCPMSTRVRLRLSESAHEIRQEAPSRWVPVVSRVIDLLREDYELNSGGFVQARSGRHNEGMNQSWHNLFHPSAESLLSIESDGWPLLPSEEEPEGKMHLLLKDVASLPDLVTKYDEVVGHLALAAPMDLGSQISAYLERQSSETDAWSVIGEWLNDKARPWRRYHACQALLSNADSISLEKQQDFWGHVVEIVTILLSDNADSNEAQVWQLETDLAGHFLRTVDLGGYDVKENRRLCVAWWAARRLSGLLTESVVPEGLPEQIRKWRSTSVFGGSRVVENAWFWLVPKAYTPARLVTLSASSARSVALLNSVGAYARAHGLESVPREGREQLCKCFCAALLSASVQQKHEERCVWEWDHSLLTAAEGFEAALQDEGESEAIAQIVEIVKRFGETGTLEHELKQLASTDEKTAVFVASQALLHSHENAEAPELLKGLFRDAEWRNACVQKLPLVAWEQLGQSLLHLQPRQGIEWSVELPYVFLRLAEAASGDRNKVELFLAGLIMSSLAGNTAGALKSLGRSPEFPALQPAITAVCEAIDNFGDIATPSMTIRLRGLATALDQL